LFSNYPFRPSSILKGFLCGLCLFTEIGYFVVDRSDAPREERPELFVKKLKACEHMFVWHEGVEPDDDPQWKRKEIKRQHLVDLIEFISENPKIFTEAVMPNIMEFVSFQKRKT
jgi:hypothetical protein